MATINLGEWVLSDAAATLLVNGIFERFGGADVLANRGLEDTLQNRVRFLKQRMRLWAELEAKSHWINTRAAEAATEAGEEVEEITSGDV